MKKVPAILVILALVLSIFGLQPRGLALASTPVVINFEEFKAVSLGGLGSYQEIGDYYQASYGVHFQGATSLSLADGSLNLAFPPYSGDALVFDYPTDYSGTMTIIFDSLVSSVGGYFTTLYPLTLTAYDALDNQVDEDDSLNAANWNGAGTGIDPNYYLEVSSTSGIAKVVIHDTGDSYTLDDLTFVPAVINVNIDIKPGSFPNSINLRSKGVVPVAILSTPDFDASTVDPETVEFEGAAPVKWEMVDVPEVWDSGMGRYIGDGDTDLLLHFKTQELPLTSASTEATLTGETFGGVPIEGTDSVRIVKTK